MPTAFDTTDLYVVPTGTSVVSFVLGEKGTQTTALPPSNTVETSEASFHTSSAVPAPTALSQTTSTSSAIVALTSEQPAGSPDTTRKGAPLEVSPHPTHAAEDASREGAVVVTVVDTFYKTVSCSTTTSPDGPSISATTLLAPVIESTTAGTPTPTLGAESSSAPAAFSSTSASTLTSSLQCHSSGPTRVRTIIATTTATQQTTIAVTQFEHITVSV